MADQFALTTDQQALLEHADRYGRERLAPLAPRMDAEDWWPDDLFPELGELGFLGLTIPERYGGVGLARLPQLSVISGVSH